MNLTQFPQKAPEEVTPKTTSGRRLQRGRKSISVISPAVKPSDADLPPFDPRSFTPGKAPPVVKAGDEEYMIIATGVKDTGLSGKYWADMAELPARRRRSQPPTPKEDEKKQQEQKQQKLSPAAKEGGGGKGKKKEDSPSTPATGKKRGPKRKQAQPEGEEVMFHVFV